MKTQRINHATPVIAGVILSSVASVGAMAHDGQPTVGTLVGQSDLVFHGVVERIEYRMSNPGGQEGTRVPYTFVTYRVNDVIRGETEGEVTLRFIGGLDEQAGRYLQTSHSPQFDLGDEDILFVQGNAQRLVPLVGDISGRLRVIDGQIYNENAHSVNLALDGSLIVGNRYLLEEAATTTVNGQIMHRDLGPQAQIGASDAMLAADLLQDLMHFAANAPAPLNAFESADINVPVDAPDMTPAAPPALPRGEQQAGDASGERVEVQTAVPVQRNGK